MAFRRAAALHENGSCWPIALPGPYTSPSSHKGSAMPRRFLAPLALLVAPLLAAEPISYSRDVQPILTAKCVACHACYDAPCQLNLGRDEGVLLGPRHQPVVDISRTYYTSDTPPLILYR